ncbi:enoyl-CoA hydratase-related protein [Blastococcus sp. SYSU DS0539]
MTSPTSPAPVLFHVDAGGVVTITLNRPSLGNAYDQELIDALRSAVRTVSEDLPDARVVVLRGAGQHFQAGADLRWMAKVREAGEAAALESSRTAARAFMELGSLPVPVLAVVRGACFGGGTGMASACDMVIAADTATFSIAEVRWGLTPGFIIPQLNDAISVRQVRRYALTGERFDASEARRIGLVHEVVPEEALDRRVDDVVAQLLRNGPAAMRTTKRIIGRFSHGGGLDDPVLEQLARDHCSARISDEARRGFEAFLAGNSPDWSVGAPDG